MKRKITIGGFAFLFLASIVAASPPTRNTSLQESRSASLRPVRRYSILVNKHDNTLRLYISGQHVRRYHVATGLYKCTPEGRFKIVQKSFISHSGRGQFGTRWLGLNTLGKRGWYRIGIHGTNEPESIGKYASKACVRMLNAHINEVYALVPLGTEVRIVNVPEKPRLTARQTPKAGESAVFPFLVWRTEETRWNRGPSQLSVQNSFDLAYRLGGKRTSRPLPTGAQPTLVSRFFSSSQMPSARNSIQ